MTRTTGLDRDTLELMLSSLDEFIAVALPEPKRLELDRDDVCPEATVRAMCSDELGVHLVFVPEEYGGLGGGAVDAYRICERLARIDIGIATSVFATFLGSDPILVGATPGQRKEWLGRIAEQGILFAYGATEPEAGSDLGALTTTATPVVTDGRITAYRLTGRKQWISNGSIADVCTILALAPGGPSWFIVEKPTPGFSAAPPEDKHGIRLSDTAALFLDDVLVPAENLVGRVEGHGLIQAQQVFGYTRVMVAAFGLGGGWEALDRAIAYSANRVQGGTPLAEKQGYTHKMIVPHAVRLEAARAFLEETATRIDADPDAHGAFNTEGAIAKYLATEFGNAAAEAAIQAHGGYGYTRPYLVEKVKRDVRITTIYEGTSEILEMTIARDRWQQHLKTAGTYYREVAVDLAEVPDACGGPVAALALQCLAPLLEACRIGRLTRNQHILLRLGELIAYAECAGALARRAAAAAAGALPAKADRRFEPAVLAAVSRVFAREAALKVSEEGLRWVVGALPAASGSVESGDSLAAALPLDRIRAAQSGLLADLDQIADALYARTQESTVERAPS